MRAMRSTRHVLELGDAGDDRVARLGLELGEGQVLELLAHVLHADAAGECRIDVERLLGDAAALGGIGDEADRAHVVQPVGELDEQDADVVRHREHELAEFSACLVRSLKSSSWESLVTPSTSPAISSPKLTRMSSRVTSVSSTVSCSRAVAMVATSSLRSVRIAATSSGWAK